MVSELDVDALLQQLAHLPGIEGVVLVSKDGLVIAQAGLLENIEADVVGATAAEIFIGALSLSHEHLGRGLLETLTFEARQGPCVIQYVNDDAFLLVLADRKTQLGLARWEARTAAAQLRAAL